MSPRVAVLVCCLLLASCGHAPAPDAVAPSPSRTSATPSPTPSAEPTLGPRQAFRAALDELDSVGRGTYVLTVMDSGSAAYFAVGRFDLRADADAARVRLMDPVRPSRRLALDLVQIAKTEYVQMVGASLGPRMTGCYAFMFDEQSAQSPLDVAVLHLEVARLMRDVRITGPSISSPEVLEGMLPVRDLAGFIGLSAGPEIRARLSGLEGDLPVEVSLDQGHLDHWDFASRDLYEVVADQLDKETLQRLVFGEFSYSLDLDPSVRIAPPPSRKVARSSSEGCAAATSGA